MKLKMPQLALWELAQLDWHGDGNINVLSVAGSKLTGILWYVMRLGGCREKYPSQKA